MNANFALHFTIMKEATWHILRVGWVYLIELFENCFPNLPLQMLMLPLLCLSTCLANFRYICSLG